MSLTCRLLLILTLSCTSMWACAGERNFDKHIPVPIGGRLTVDLDIGAVTVTGTEAHEVVVRARAWGDDDSLTRLSLHVESTSAGVQVHETYTQGLWTWFGGNRVHVQFTIEVPRDYPVQISTNGGSLELASLNAPVQGKTNGGGIKVYNVHGSVDVRTLGGGIAAEHIQGQVRLSTAGGSIEARDVHGDLEARTLGGSISLADVDGALSAHTAGGSVSAVELGDHDVTLQTNGGSIHLRMPATIHASLDASTVGGRVQSDIPLSTTESAGHSFLRGSFNGAGHTIQLHTIGGGIRIEPLA
jgi:DUF4097 and DUF4098 domain-containing protein YvlB